MVEGFGGLMAGMVVASITNPDTNGNTTPTKFAWGIRGGANIWARERFAIKLHRFSCYRQCNQWVWFVLGTGIVGAGVSSYSSIYQFGLGGGLTFALGK